MPSETTTGVSAYPLENIMRDVAGEMLADHLMRMTERGIGEHYWARLIGRAQEVNRHDLVPTIVENHAPTAAALAGLTSQAIRLRAQLVDYCRQGPVPTPEAYKAACSSLENATRDAERAGRDALDAYRDGHHRASVGAPGYCICGNGWESDGCEEYQSLTGYRWAMGADGC